MVCLGNKQQVEQEICVCVFVCVCVCDGASGAVG